MGQVKCNKNGLTNLITYLNTITTNIDNIFSSITNSVQSLNNDAITHYTDLLATTEQYTKNEQVALPKYLYNKKCYDSCPSDSNIITDETNNKCKCKYAFHTLNIQMKTV